MASSSGTRLVVMVTLSGLLKSFKPNQPAKRRTIQAAHAGASHHPSLLERASGLCILNVR